MYLHRTSVAQFSAIEAHLAERLAEQMRFQAHQSPSASERRSWERSLPRLRDDLLDAGLGSVEMVIEYQLPLSSKRADVVLAGQHPRTGDPSYVVVELKQWGEASQFEDSDTLVHVDSYGARPVTHPLIQVEGYRDYIEDFLTALADQPHDLTGAVYLHNATRSGVSDLVDMAYRWEEPQVNLFTGEGRGEFKEFLSSRLATDSDGATAADLLLGSRYSPSRQLLKVAADEVQRREMFTLLDEQRTAYDLVLHATDKAHRANHKTAVVVTGGPGSGKSVIALSLMGELSRRGRTVMHATGSQSFTKTLRKVAGARNTRVKKLFAYFNSFINTDTNELDCLILDEAHRIRETSANRFTKKQDRTGRPQIDELLDVARVPVFLLDQNQVVRPGETGTVELIVSHARSKGIDVQHVSLDDQFRCGGSEAYIDWVERLLGLRPGGPISWHDEDGFHVGVVDSPEELEAALRVPHEDGYTARMAAGFCWPWSDPTPDGHLVGDVHIGSWQRPWNLKGDRAIGGAPPSALWATDPAGFAQVGCIYTAQGFEYDVAGVILGPDMVWREDRWAFVRSANKDPALRLRTSVSDEHFARLVTNVYKVLLTRGMQSVYIYSTDEETRRHLQSLIRVRDPFTS